MASLNSCSFTGNLTRDAESKMIGENEVCTFAIAVNGRKEGDVMFLNCDLWRPGGVAEYLTRGKQVAVSGELRCKRYEKEGVKKEIWTLDVKNLALLGSREREEAASPF